MSCLCGITQIRNKWLNKYDTSSYGFQNYENSNTFLNKSGISRSRIMGNTASKLHARFHEAGA